MLRILFVNQHYWPDRASTGQYLVDVAEHLAAVGYEVRVLCARERSAKKRKGKHALPKREVRNGVEIVRVDVPSPTERRGRMGTYARFHAAVGPRLLATKWPNIVVTLTTPPMLGFWGSLGRKLRGYEHVCYLMDHHPDAEFEAGMLRRKSLTGRALESAYRWTLRNASHNVVLGPYQAQRVTGRGVPAERISEVPVWSWADEIHGGDAQREALRRELRWDGFVVLYSGNAGQVHRFDELLETMRSLDGNRRVHFAFVGGGPRRAELEAFAREHWLTNVSFHADVPRERVGDLLSAADAHFVSLRPEQVGVSVPGKLYGQLASARPVLFVGPENCETADDIRASGAGFTFGVGQSAALTDRILELQSDPEECRRIGSVGRAWFLRNRERARACAAWTKLLERIGGVRTGRVLPFPQRHEESCAS